MTKAKQKTWATLFPNGRHIYYEGGDPVAFKDLMAVKYQLDVTAEGFWHEKDGWCFLCPPHLLDEVYTTYKCGS